MRRKTIRSPHIYNMMINMGCKETSPMIFRHSDIPFDLDFTATAKDKIMLRLMQIFRENEEKTTRGIIKNSLNTHRHWYLYCKGWYKRTDIVKDLAIIQSRWSGIDANHITEYDVLSVVLTILHKHIKTKSDFFRFINNSLEGNVKYVGGTSNDGHIKRMLLSAKSIIAATHMSDIDGELGEPDFSILPKNENSLGREEQCDAPERMASVMYY